MDRSERAEEDLRAVLALLEVVEADADTFDERDVEAVRADLQDAVAECEDAGSRANSAEALARRAATLEEADVRTAVLRRRPALMTHFVSRQAALEEGRDRMGVGPPTAPSTPHSGRSQ